MLGCWTESLMGVRSLNRNNATSGSTWLAKGNSKSQCLGFTHHHRNGAYCLFCFFFFTDCSHSLLSVILSSYHYHNFCSGGSRNLFNFFKSCLLHVQLWLQNHYLGVCLFLFHYDFDRLTTPSKFNLISRSMRSRTVNLMSLRYCHLNHSAIRGLYSCNHHICPGVALIMKVDEYKTNHHLCAVTKTTYRSY